MKVVIEEKLKHRLVGIAVIVSVAVVFAPAILKKSQGRFEDSVSVSVKLPPRPILPKVTVREPDVLFHEVKVAKVEIPVVQAGAYPVPTIARAKPLSIPITAPVVNIAQASLHRDTKREGVSASGKKPNSPQFSQTAELDIKPHALVVSNKTVAISQIPAIKATTGKQQLSTIAKGAYGVQLATFAVHENAIALVNKLKHQGYQANYEQIPGKNGTMYYKVVVGNAAEREEALRLQKKLAQTLQIKGFIVKGVS